MSSAGHVVVATARDDLRASVTRLAVVAGATVEPVATSAAIRSAWRGARAIVVGADLAGAVAALGLPRRADLVVVADAEPDAGLWRAAVSLGAAAVLRLPDDEPVLVDVLGSALDSRAAAGRVVAVTGGCGGAGASTLAAALATTSAASHPTMLLDGDGLGGGLDLLMGAERRAGARWPDLAATRGRLATAELDAALVQADGVRLLSFGRESAPAVAPAAVTAVLDAATRAFEVTVVDLPRHSGPMSELLTGAADLVIVVVPATVRAAAAAMSRLHHLARDRAELRLVVRDPAAGQLTDAELASSLGLPVAARFRSESTVGRAALRGEAPLRGRRGGLQRGSLKTACEHLLAELDEIAAR